MGLINSSQCVRPSVHMYTEAIHCTEAFHCSCPCIRPSIRTLRLFVAPANVHPSIRTYANMTHCTELFLCTCPSACQSIQSQTHRKVMHDRVESASYIRTFRTEWTNPRLHCRIQVALSLSVDSATFLRQCPRLNTVLPYYTLKKNELQVISDAYAHYKSVISGKPEAHNRIFQR